MFFPLLIFGVELACSHAPPYVSSLFFFRSTTSESSIGVGLHENEDAHVYEINHIFVELRFDARQERLLLVLMKCCALLCNVFLLLVFGEIIFLGALLTTMLVVVHGIDHEPLDELSEVLRGLINPHLFDGFWKVRDSFHRVDAFPDLAEDVGLRGRIRDPEVGEHLLRDLRFHIQGPDIFHLGHLFLRDLRDELEVHHRALLQALRATRRGAAGGGQKSGDDERCGAKHGNLLCLPDVEEPGFYSCF